MVTAQKSASKTPEKQGLTNGLKVSIKNGLSRVEKPFLGFWACRECGSINRSSNLHPPTDSKADRG